MIKYIIYILSRDKNSRRRRKKKFYSYDNWAIHIIVLSNRRKDNNNNKKKRIDKRCPSFCIILCPMFKYIWTGKDETSNKQMIH